MEILPEDAARLTPDELERLVAEAWAEVLPPPRHYHFDRRDDATREGPDS